MMRGYYNTEKILETYRKELPEVDSDWPPAVQEVENCIHRNLFDWKLSVNWVKEECHISGKSFSARFNLCTGYYPLDYIIHHRTEASKRLLVQTRASVTEIALAVGYTSLSAFCNTFKNNECCRPSEWRRQSHN